MAHVWQPGGARLGYRRREQQRRIRRREAAVLRGRLPGGRQFQRGGEPRIERGPGRPVPLHGPLHRSWLVDLPHYGLRRGRGEERAVPVLRGGADGAGDEVTSGESHRLSHCLISRISLPTLLLLFGLMVKMMMIMMMMIILMMMC